MNEKFGKLLSNIDLSPTQIKIYLSVLKLGLCTVLDTSKNTKINRSQIYFDTSILVERGLLELAAKRKRKFLAVQPSKINKIIEEKSEKLKELQGVLGEATSFYEKGKNIKDDKFEIKIFEGLSQVKKAFQFELEDSKGSEALWLIGDLEYQETVFLSYFWDSWINKFYQNKSNGRMLIDNKYLNENLVANKFKKNILVRGLENFGTKTNINIWKDKVLIVSVSNSPKAVLIENQVIAGTYKEIFSKFWKLAK